MTSTSESHENAFFARDERMDKRKDGRMDGRMDGRLEIHPCVLQDIGPLGPLPKKESPPEFYRADIYILPRFREAKILPTRFRQADFSLKW